MKVTFPQTIYDNWQGVNCNFEVVDEDCVTVKDFHNAVLVRVEVDHPFDAHVIHKAREAFAWGVSKACEFQIRVAGVGKAHVYYIRQGDTLSISPSESGPGDVTKVTFRDEPKGSAPAQGSTEYIPEPGKADDEEESEKVPGLANV